MRIAIDARELCGRPTGVGRYLASLLAAWSGLPEAAAHRFVLYAPASVAEPLHRVPPVLEYRLVPASGADGAPAGTAWEQVQLARHLRRDKPDVLFAPAYTAPLAAGVPVVLTIHDLSFVAHPEWFPFTMRWRQRALTMLSARRARHVLTVSEFSRREIVERLGVAPARVSAIPHGLTIPSGVGEPAGAGPREPLVLFVGSIFNRRHVVELIRAVAAVAHRHAGVRLEVVGENRTFPRQDLESVISGAGMTGRARLRSYVSDETLAGLYTKAGLFVFLSDYEGFGLTPLEALAAGIPILVGDTPVAREVYGEAGTYVRPTDEAAIASDIERLLFDQGARAAVLSRAPAVLARYSWERAGRDTLAAIVGSPAATRA